MILGCTITQFNYPILGLDSIFIKFFRILTIIPISIEPLKLFKAVFLVHISVYRLYNFVILMLHVSCLSWSRRDLGMRNASICWTNDNPIKMMLHARKTLAYDFRNSRPLSSLQSFHSSKAIRSWISKFLW